MTATTTVRLPEALKSRVARAARRAGTTPHGFILEAISEKAIEAERKHALHALADERFAAIARTGKTLPWQGVRKHLETLATGGLKPRRATRKTGHKA